MVEEKNGHKRNGYVVSKPEPNTDHSIDIPHKIEGGKCYNAFNKNLIKVFRAYGEFVGKHPLWFIIIPIIVTCLLGTGFFRINIEDNPMVLFVPLESPFMQESENFNKYFPVNYTDGYSVTRLLDYDGNARSIVKAKDGGSIFRKELWPDIFRLNGLVVNKTAHLGNESFTYEDVCARFRGKCVQNSVLNIYEMLNEIETGENYIPYPISLFPFILPQMIGSPTINEGQDSITDAKAVQLVYFTINYPGIDKERSRAWEAAVLEVFKEFESDYLDISYYVGRALEDELVIKMNSSLPFAPLTGFIMIFNCMALLWMNDCIRSKPYVGLIGIISATMAAVAGFGLLIYCGVTYTRLNAIALFLVLGIGVDDIFVAISAWEKTSHKDPVPKRLAHCYADAAISVTITSVTNCLSFLIGTTTTIYIVRNFCLYCACTVAFAYLWFVTFCGAFLALSGYMEERRMHCLFFYKLKPTHQPKHEEKNIIKKFIKKFLFTSDLTRQDVDPNAKVKPHFVAVFFRDKVGNLLLNTKFRVFVVISLILYLAASVYGCLVLKRGLYRTRMARDDSFIRNFHEDDGTHFRTLPYNVQVMITGNLTYSDPNTRDMILDTVSKMENSTFGSSRLFTQSWVRRLNALMKIKKDLRERIVDEPSLIEYLQSTEFLKPTDPRTLDMKFSDDNKRIEASRVVIQMENVSNVFEDSMMMNELRQIAEDSPLNVTLFHIFFGLFDQTDMLRPIAIQSISIATVIVIVVALLFIPTVNGAIVIAFSIISIAMGVIGFMGFWDVNLDQVSVGSIFMCIGFSVDFAAHITYAYSSLQGHSTEDKIRLSLYNLGLPIVQGGLTTVESLMVFLLIPGYGYRTFFKTITLVTVFAMYFSIIIIPLGLAFLEYIQDLCCSKEKNDTIDGVYYNRKNYGSYVKDRKSAQQQSVGWVNDAFSID